MLHKFVLFFQVILVGRMHRNTKKLKHAQMHKNASLCTDACNTPVYYTPVSVR